MALKGNEILYVQGIAQNNMPSGEQFPTTTAAIAALASDETSFVTTNITTVGNGTLTAPALLGNQIVRTGPVANFSDATAAATAIIAAFPGGIAAGSSTITIKNATAYTQTITAGLGVTLPPTVIVAPYSAIIYSIVPTSASAVTFYHLESVPIAIGQNVTAPAIVSISSTGSTGTVLATSFAGGLTSRTGPTGAFTDTTDTAANIIASCANLVGKIGASFIYYYSNNSAYVATLTGGMGVTVSGITTVPPNTIGAFLVTYTAAATLTMVGIGVTQSISTQVTIAGATSGYVDIQAPTTAGAGAVTLPSFATGAETLKAGPTVYGTALTTATTTLAPVPGLFVPLATSGTYSIIAALPMTTVAAGTGVSVAAAASNSLTATSFNVTSKLISAAAQAAVNTTTLGGNMSATAAVVLAELTGTIVVNTGGTLIIEAAQSVSSTASITLAAGGFLSVARIS